MKLARCPSCRASLDMTRTIEERWSQADARGLWVYRVSCASCLAIARVERPEIDGAGRAPKPAATIDTDGAVVTRVMERLRAAEAHGEIRAELERLRASDERTLLRVPEVVAIAGHVFSGRMRLARTLMCVREPAPGFRVLHGEIELYDPGDEPRIAELEPGAKLARGFSDGVILVPAGIELSVRSVRAGSVLLAPGRLPIDGLPMSFDGVDAFVVPPDSLAPHVESP